MYKMSIEKHIISYFNASAKDCPWLNDQITHKPLHTKAPDQFQKQVLQVSASQLLENQSSPEARQTTRSKHAGNIKALSYLDDVAWPNNLHGYDESGYYCTWDDDMAEK